MVERQCLRNGYFRSQSNTGWSFDGTGSTDAIGTIATRRDAIDGKVTERAGPANPLVSPHACLQCLDGVDSILHIAFDQATILEFGIQSETDGNAAKSLPS